MAAISFFLLPEVKGESFSGSICKILKTEEEVLVKSKLLMFLDLNQEAVTVTWFGENPIVRSSTMKHLLALFESVMYKEAAERRLDVAIKLIVENAKLPSEIQEGLAFVRSYAMKNPFPPQASGAEDSQIRVQIASALMTLLNKLAMFELCEAKIGKEKRDASRAMGCLLFRNPFDAKSSECIIESLKLICPTENGEGVVNLICKEDGNYAQATVDFNNLHNFGIEGSRDFEGVSCFAKWIESGPFRKEIRYNNDWICVAELLTHFLNATIVDNTKITEELDPFLCGRDRDGALFMVKVCIFEGVISVRGKKKTLCDHVVTKINTVIAKMGLMI